MGRPLIYAAMTKAGYLFLLTASVNSVTWQKAVALIWIRHSSNVSKLSADQTPVCTAVAGWEVLWTSELPMQQISFPPERQTV